MNSSAVSVYDNVTTPISPSKSVVYGKLNDLLHINTDLEMRIYCPLCVNSFSFKFSLFEHLKTSHDNFLTRASNQTLRFTECPFCNAKFYGKHLTAKHVLHHHSKVVRGLFVNKTRFECSFCNLKLNKGPSDSVVKHIEDQHFLDFEEEFRKMFSYESAQDMSVHDLVNSTADGENVDSANWEDVCRNVGKHSGNKLSGSDVKDFDEASKVNLYDFTDLKQQLKNIKDTTEPGVSSPSKSILKDIKNSSTHQKSARRVLRFDLPFDSEDKENLVFKENISVFKQINSNIIGEHYLLCDDKKPDLFLKSIDTFCEEPQHSSTPNGRLTKMFKDVNKKNTENCKSTFKLCVNGRKTTEYEFKCGKCRLLFKENLDLVSHVKNNHKKFSLNAFQPCYHCAICNARFYKNRYLRKHHSIHKPY